MQTGSEPTMHPWDRLPGESVAAHTRFLHFRDQGMCREQKITAEAFGVSKPTIHGQCLRFRWLERAKAWDQHIELDHESSPVPARLLTAAVAASTPGHHSSAPKVDDIERAREIDHEGLLETFRAESEQVGKAQMQLARAFTSAAGRNVARILKTDQPLNARDVAVLASASCTLAASATATWGRAIGVDRLLSQMAAMVELEERQALQQVEVVT